MISRSDLIRKTKETLREYALQPNKNLGQNFCVEPAILDLITSQLEIIQPKAILEVGGGLGTLSERLITFNKPLTIVEKDSNLAVLLEQKFGSKNVKIHNIDIMQLDDKKLADYDMVIGNIPYEISSPLLFKIWSNKTKRNNSPHILLTIQKEFALRLAAKPGTQDYGRLSAMTQLFTVPKILKIYPPSAFYPVPKVAHGVIYLEPIEQVPVLAFSNEFATFMIALFNRKNKKVINSIEPIIKKQPSETIESVLRKNDLFLKRVRDVKPLECIKLFEIWTEKKKEYKHK